MQRTFHCPDATARPAPRFPAKLPERAKGRPFNCVPEAKSHGLRVRAVIEPLVEQVFGILSAELRAVTRGRARVALARQVAMYLTHVVCQLSLTDVGRVFARDRTTVAHACTVVEDLRDDPGFDRVLELIEAVLLFRMKVSAPLTSLAVEARTR